MLVTKYKKLAGVFILLFAAYFVLIVLLPVDKATLRHYHLTKAKYDIVILTIVIPYLIIGFVALIGHLRLRTYTETIRKSRDGLGFQTISSGILWLALWLPVSALLGNAFSGYYQAHPGSTEVLVIINNYVNILILLGAFTQINRGSKKLLTLIKRSESTLPQWLMAAFIAFAAFYPFLVLQDAARQFPTHTVTVATYYMSDWLTIFTIVIPRLITWFLGIQAVYNIYLYRQKIRGAIYKTALHDLVKGLSITIIALVILRCFQSLTSQLASLSLGGILLIIYVLLILIGGGYVLIARGAQSLQRIEEV